MQKTMVLSNMKKLANQIEALVDQNEKESRALNLKKNGRLFKAGERLKLKKDRQTWGIKNIEFLYTVGGRITNQEEYDRGVELQMMLAMFGDDMDFVFVRYGSGCARVDIYLEGQRLDYTFYDFKNLY